MTRTTVRLPDELLAQAQAYAARTGRTFTQLMTDALRHEMQRPAMARRVCEPLPTFGADGVRPGVDLANNAALLDLMDGL